MTELISKSTRNQFREVLSDYSVLRHIDLVFDGAGLTPDREFDPQIGGARRTLVEQYYVKVDFSSREDVHRVLTAYAEIIAWLRDSQRHEVADGLTARLHGDGYEYMNGGFDARHQTEMPIVELIRQHAVGGDLPELRTQIDRLMSSIEDDPALAVGTAKELIETVCKTILDERNVVLRDDDMGKLIRAVTRELRLDPSSISENARGSETIRRTLANLGQVVQGIAELRNLYGTGHGRAGRTSAIKPRHARLAVGAATTLAMFLLETHLEQTEAATPLSSRTDC